jgi:hypothetical protein
VLVEVVGRFVEEQEVVVCSEEAGETDPVALPDRHGGEPAAAVGDRAEFLQCDVDAPVCVPRVERRDVVERCGVLDVSACSALGECAGGRVETAHRCTAVGQLDVDEIADRPASLDGHLLFGDAETADARDLPGVGSEPAGEYVEQRRLAASVLSDDAEPGAGGDGDRDVGEHLTAAAFDADTRRHQLRARPRPGSAVDGHENSSFSQRRNGLPGATERTGGTEVTAPPNTRSPHRRGCVRQITGRAATWRPR